MAPVGTTLQPVDVLSQDDDALVCFHAPVHDIGDDIDGALFNAPTKRLNSSNRFPLSSERSPRMP